MQDLFKLNNAGSREAPGTDDAKKNMESDIACANNPPVKKKSKLPKE